MFKDRSDVKLRTLSASNVYHSAEDNNAKIYDCSFYMESSSEEAKNQDPKESPLSKSSYDSEEEDRKFLER